MESMDWKGIKKCGHTMKTSGLLIHELCEHYSTAQWLTRLRDLVFTGREFTSKLTLRKARKIKSTKRGDVYPMHKKERGFCIIINNQMFADPELTFRSGSRADAYRLSDVFSQLGFDVQMFANRTSDQMKELLMRFRDKEADLSTHDALAVIILSHGCKDGVYGSDGQVVPVETILRYFNNNCMSLIGKPKIFFVTACRGGEYKELFFRLPYAIIQLSVIISR
jgi:hypothetical protein